MSRLLPNLPICIPTTTTLSYFTTSPELTAALSKVLLHQQKFSEANDLLLKAINTNANSAILLAAAGFVQVRTGSPWTASESAARALALDPCNPRVRLLECQLLRLNSMFKSAAEQLQIAHSLDPYDPEIREEWMARLQLKERIQYAEDSSTVRMVLMQTIGNIGAPTSTT